VVTNHSRRRNWPHLIVDERFLVDALPLMLVFHRARGSPKMSRDDENGVFHFLFAVGVAKRKQAAIGRVARLVSTDDSGLKQSVAQAVEALKGVVREGSTSWPIGNIWSLRPLQVLIHCGWVPEVICAIAQSSENLRVVESIGATDEGRCEVAIRYGI